MPRREPVGEQLDPNPTLLNVMENLFSISFCVVVSVLQFAPLSQGKGTAFVHKSLLLWRVFEQNPRFLVTGRGLINAEIANTFVILYAALASE